MLEKELTKILQKKLKAQSKKSYHIGLIHSKLIPENCVQDFLTQIESPKLKLNIKKRTSRGPYNCIEWLIPSAFILSIPTIYVTAFIGEIAKDHYPILKKGIWGLWKKLYSKNKTIPTPTIRAVSTGKKLGKGYSFIFSIISYAKDGRKMKFLVKENISYSDFKVAIGGFLEFLHDYHVNHSIEIPDKFSNILHDKTLFLTYDKHSKKIKFLDMYPPDVRKKIPRNK